MMHAGHAAVSSRSNALLLLLSWLRRSAEVRTCQVHGGARSRRMAKQGQCVSQECHIKLLLLILGLNNARAPAAHMSTGPTGGGGRENLLYSVAVGTACVGGGIYVSKTKQSTPTIENMR